MRCSSLLESTLLLLPKKRNPCSLYSRAEFRRETVSTPFCYTLLKKGFFRKNKLDTASVWLENTLIAINHSSKLIFTKGFAQGILNVLAKQNMSVQSMWSHFRAKWRISFLVTRFFMSAGSWFGNIPVHVLLSVVSWYPSLQEHLYPPRVLLQIFWQSWPVLHSSMS